MLICFLALPRLFVAIAIVLFVKPILFTSAKAKNFLGQLVVDLVWCLFF